MELQNIVVIALAGGIAGSLTINRALQEVYVRKCYYDMKHGIPVTEGGQLGLPLKGDISTRLDYLNFLRRNYKK